MRFRVRHFEPSWDWWIAIDDVLVDDLDLARDGAVTVMATQSFSAGIPMGWSLVGLNSGEETWHATDKGGRYVAGSVSGQGVNRLQHPAFTPDFAMLDSGADPDPTEDELLLTPVFDCSLLSSVRLRFASEILPDVGAVAEVLLSLDGGASFEPRALFSYAGGGLIESGEEPHFARRVLAAPAAAGVSQVVFAFRSASPGNRWWWAIDDVSVTGD